MQRITSYLLCAGLFAPVLSAQAGPGMLDADPGTTGQQAMVKSIYFSSVDNASTNLWDVTPKIWTTSGRNITQVHLGKGILGLKPGEYHMTMTTSSLDTAWTTGAGGVAGSGDVIMGKVSFNGATPVFTPSTAAALMNSAGNDFGLTLSGDGTRAVLDWPTGPYWSMRTLALSTKQFQKPVALTGQTGTYVDPCPGKIGGVMGCFWVSSGTQISWAPVKETITSGKLTAAALDTAKTIAAITSPNQPHSPTPVLGTSGNVRGLWFSRVTGSDSDQYYSGQVPDATGGIRVYDSSAWSNNGGTAGSRLICAYSGHYNTLLEGRGSHGGCNSDITVAAAASLDITIHAPVSNPTLFTSLMGVALGVGTPIPLPGICGALGLDATKLAVIATGPTGLTADETAEVSLPASNSGLKGLTLHLQFVTSPTAGFGPCFTNTMSPKFK